VVGGPDPDKPNDMHGSTYNRLRDQADELDDLGWGYVASSGAMSLTAHCVNASI